MTADQISNTDTLTLRCSVLIVGSLLWKEDETGIRAAWRGNRLDLVAATPVEAHLRYGRRSQGWGDTFTMILDEMAPGGQALLAPCKASVHSFEDLLDEVRWLWSAEDNKPPSNRFHKSWGCVAALFGPNVAAAGLPEQWKDHFQTAKPALPDAVDKAGLLSIPWPNISGGEMVRGTDIILATATTPRPADRRPSPQEIAKAWIDQNAGHERYFLENLRHGIRTGDDAEIWSVIEEANPQWLRSEQYADVVEMLRREAGALTQTPAGSVSPVRLSAGDFPKSDERG
jgi:hypothetical protein